VARDHDEARKPDQPRSAEEGRRTSPGVSRVLALQRSVGNRATARVLARDGPSLTAPAQLTLDPQFMPPPTDFKLTSPDVPFGYRPHALPRLDLHDRPASLRDLGAGQSSVPGVGFNALDALRTLRTLPDPPVTLTLPPDVPPAASTDDPAQQQIGAQWTWSAGKAKPDRTVQVQFQKGDAVIQGSLSLDSGTVQWLAGVQHQVSTREVQVLGALVSAQAFVQVLAGVTVDGGAGGQFTLQVASGAQLTIKWGPITAQLQAGPQVAWTPRDGWSAGLVLAPGAGPTDPGAPGLPPTPGFVGVRIPF
jgi:hypothetical protein